MIKDNLMNNYPEQEPYNKDAKKLMVLLHGIGSDGYDLLSLTPYIREKLPYYHFISPHGIEEYDLAPEGRQWFSLQDRSYQVVLALLKKNIPKINDIIRIKQNQLQLTNKDTILCGFSQGAMVALYLTLSTKNPYSATISFSGRLIPPDIIENTNSPIAVIHGQDDSIISSEESKKTISYLNQYNIKNDHLIIPKLKHSIDMIGLNFAINFLINQN